MRVLSLAALTLALASAATATANPGDQTQLEKYADNRYKQYRLELPGKHPITIIETAATDEPPNSKWVDISVNFDQSKDDVALKNVMTDIIHDPVGGKPRCYGPSCQEGFVEDQGPQGDIEEMLESMSDKSKDYRDYPSDRLQAISALAAKLKKDKIKADRLYQTQSSTINIEDDEDDNNGKVYTAWNRLKVKQHKHTYDDQDGWVTLEPVAWSTSKISKWKPNVKKHNKPSVWNSNNDNDDRYTDEDQYSGYLGAANTQVASYPTKRPSSSRPAYINNKFHISSSPVASNWDTEMPSKPSWNKPDNYYSYPSTWNPDDGRRPKPNCDSDESQSNVGDTVYYGSPDSLVTDSRPSYFPYEYEALKRPIRRPTQVVYAGHPDIDSERASRPPFSDGQWVLLSTTKGYRNKKRQRSLSPDADRDFTSPQTITSHQAVALTVLPMDDSHSNMTTSHGGLLEVERSFQTVEEAKRDMDRKNEFRPEEYAASETKPTSNRVVRRKIITSAAPDGNTLLAAVGAGMVPATMAMVVPMLLGRRRRDVSSMGEKLPLDHTLFKYE